MAYNTVVISSGHSINCQGMSDVINEVNEAKRVVNRVYDIVVASGKNCFKYHDTASSSSQNLRNIVAFHNSHPDGVDVSVHFNANVHTNNPMGVEVCYYSQLGLAQEMSRNIAKVSGLRDRGAKERTGLYVLKHTNKPSILIEVCFGDSVADCNIYNAKFEEICQAIARTLIGEIHVPGNTGKSDNKGDVNRSMYVFSQNWYLFKYPDVANSGYKDDPYQHYVQYGKKEGRLPIPPIPDNYSEHDYLELNPDIADAVKKGIYHSGIEHYIQYGFKENRKVNK